MSAAIVPILAMAALIWGLIRKVDIYAAFVEGAKEALPTLLRVLPFMAAMLLPITLLSRSGLIDELARLLSPALAGIGLPAELLPLAILHPLSGSASMAAVADLFSRFGPDSFIGLTASVMVGSSETVFYTLGLYFGAAEITDTRYTLPVALVSMLAGLAASLLISNLLWA